MKIKKMVVLIPAVVLLTACAMAQYTPPQYGDEANSESRSAATVEGCLSVANGSDARYTLTDSSGEVYRLTGNTDRLRAYVGQTIRVRGINSTIVYTPGAMSEGTDEEAQTTLSVRSFRRISGICQGTSNNP